MRENRSLDTVKVNSIMSEYSLLIGGDRMARHLSEIKRAAILDAATGAIASLGLAASTANIAKDAGVADGTLFIYFPTKDDLLNQLYLHLKADLRVAVTVGYPSGGSVRDQFRHFWNRYIEWGVSFPEKHHAICQLSVSAKLTQATRRSAWVIFSDVEEMVAEGFRSGVLRKQPAEFLGRIMDTIVSIVLETAVKEPSKLKEYKLLGWNALWGAISPV
jgi:AcrR family transcriptional regulator